MVSSNFTSSDDYTVSETSVQKRSKLVMKKRQVETGNIFNKQQINKIDVSPGILFTLRIS